MIKILFQISKKIEKEYLESLEEAIDSINKEFTDKEIFFEYSTYSFSKLEKGEIETETDSFLNSKAITELHCKTAKRHNSIVYIPDSSTNLKGNYLWYSIGAPQDHIMVISSFIFKNLLNERLNFGAYILLIYSQFIARYTTKLDEPHDRSRNCLNDHCANQIEVLNVFNNAYDVLCEECLSRITSSEYHGIIKKIIKFIRNKYYKKTGKAVLRARVEVVRPKVKVEFDEGYSYEFEIFMAKKCVNLSKLYKKIDELLKNPYSKIDGYSLYEVDGGWRGKVNLSEAGLEDWRTLKSLKQRFGGGDFKNLINPIFEDNKNNKFAVFDERSIVLKIAITSKFEIKTWDEKSHEAIREIVDIFDEITEDEKSIFFTLKRLDRTGYIKRKNGD